MPPIAFLAINIIQAEPRVSILAYLIMALLVLSLYFLPAILGRRKQNALAIFVLNLLLGWTFLGWVVALVWALTKDAHPVSLHSYAAPHPPEMSAPPPTVADKPAARRVASSVVTYLIAGFFVFSLIALGVAVIGALR